MPAQTISVEEDTLFVTLQHLLAIQTTEIRATLDQASTLVSEALAAEKVDVFLFVPGSQSLEAMGTSNTPLGRLQHATGLDRLPLANGGPLIDVYVTGEPYVTGSANLNPDEPRGYVQALGIRSQLGVPLDVNGEREGVLSASSTLSESFSRRDLQFLVSVSCWIGMVIHRANLIAIHEQQAVERGRRDAGNELALLTHRHIELVTCIAEGLSNDEIAERLSLVSGTVANHVRAILARLALSNRVQIAVWGVEHGLYRTEHVEDETPP